MANEDGAARTINMTDAIGPLSSGKVFTGRTSQPTWQASDSDLGDGELAPASAMANPITDGTWNGRHGAVLAACFPCSTLGLEAYNPLDYWKKVMNPALDTTNILWPVTLDEVDDWGMGGLTSHMTYSYAPNLNNFSTTDTGTINAFVPNISAGVIADPAAASAGETTLKEAFETLYDGKQESFDSDSQGLHAGDIAVGGPNPSDMQAKLGGWVNDFPSLGEWTAAADS